MAEKTENVKCLQGLNLLVSKPLLVSPDPEKCIICQKKGTKSERLHSGETGRKRVWEAAELKDDIVKKRLKALGPDATFRYHNTNACYKKYTDIRNLPSIPESKEQDDIPENEESLQSPSTRSTNAPRPGPSTNINPIHINCVICGNDRVRVQGERIREKYRISSHDKALNFIEVMHSKRDEVFVRCADLTTPEHIFAADIYCHKTCFIQYVHPPSQSETIQNPPVTAKHELFMSALVHLDPLIKDGYGFTVTEIKEFMLSYTENDNTELYNRDVKKFLLDHYGEKIRFCPSHRANESEFCFSSEISVDDVAKKLRDMNVIKSCGETIRDALKKVDFKLNDKFCDGYELKKSWEQTQMPDVLLTFFAALFGIKKSRMLKIEMINMMLNNEDDVSMANDDSSDENSEDIEWAILNKHNQLNCLFQIIYYQMFNGSKKTPLHASFGHYQYGKSRSREILTIANRIGVSSSYCDVRRSRRHLAAYAVNQSARGEVPIPSSFTRDTFTIGAMDNADFSDKSSLSGMESDHVTMQVLYQETIFPSSSKPLVSDINLRKTELCLPDKLPCQVVPHLMKPATRPVLPPDFKVVEELNLIDTQSALECANKQEFLISFMKCGLPSTDAESGILPTWSGFHALISTSTVPMMRVGFLPMIPSPVTDYATVYKALQNFQSVRRQLNPSQSIIPVFCDEGVFHTVADILMDQPAKFADIHGMMGMFHWVKVLLKCAGHFLRGSGIEDGLIETEIFGKMTLNSVLEGSHYVRSFLGMSIISDVISSLMWEAFWSWMREQGQEIDGDVMECALELKTALCNKSKSDSATKFGQLLKKSDYMHQKFQVFIKECQSKSELCQYWGVFQQIVLIIKHIISSDREGNFALHMAAVEKSLPIFQESDSINYLRYGSFYFESTKLLQNTHPEIFQRLLQGQFVIKDHTGCFNAVAPDMKLEQTIQRASKSTGGIVGQTKNSAIVVEWQLIFHEILLISNNLRALTNDSSMDHSESAAVHHDLVGKKAEHVNKNVAKLLDFVSSRGNPFIIEAPGLKLHNFVTKEVADDAVSMRLCQALQNGDNFYQEFRKERFIEKKKKLSATISKRNLPQMNYKPSSENKVPGPTISQNMLASAQRDIDIVRERGMSLELIYSHDFVPNSIIFEGDLASKPDKSKLIIEIEKHLEPQDTKFTQGNATVIVDFMSKIRSYPNLSSFGTFSNAINAVLSAGQSICTRTGLHVVFDSYMECSIKGGERLRRSDGTGTVNVVNMGPDVPIPQQMEKFWPSPSNKTELQHLTCVLATKQHLKHPIILSGYVADDEVVSSKMVPSEGSNEEASEPVKIDALTCNIEEADDRLLLHCSWEVGQGCKRLLVISNDTDTVVRLLHFVRYWQDLGLQELWVEFGSGDRRRHLPIHTLANKMGSNLCKILLKVHVLTGDDAVSKIGTKYAALACEPHKYLDDFGETSNLTEQSAKLVEEYLVRVWTGAGRTTLCQTFDALRLESHMKSKTPKPLSHLPPTSSVIQVHIKRSYFIIHNVHNILTSRGSFLDPKNYGWIYKDGILLPEKGLNPLPAHMLTLCKCAGRCHNKHCPCKKGEHCCVVYCHKSQESCCQNN